MRFTTYYVCLHVLALGEERREVKYLVRRPLPASRANFELSEKNEQLAVSIFRHVTTDRNTNAAGQRHRQRPSPIIASAIAISKMCQTVRHQKVHVRSWQL